MKKTIKDVAKAAGVSVATASRVLSGGANVSTEIRARVQTAVKEIAYEPQRRSRKRVIALIAPSTECIPADQYLSIVNEALTREAFSRNYDVIIVPERNVFLLRYLPMQGAISILFGDGLEQRWARFYKAPLIAINSADNPGGGVWRIGSNELQGMELAVDHLYNAGHRKIGLSVIGIPNNGTNQHRLLGYRQAMQRRGLSVESGWVQTFEGGDFYETLGNLLLSGITALLCPGETSGLRLIHGLGVFGRKIPSDLSVITYDVPQIYQYTTPPLSCLRQDLAAISRGAIDLLETAIAAPARAKSAIVDYRFVERGSTAIIQK